MSVNNEETKRYLNYFNVVNSTNPNESKYRCLVSGCTSSLSSKSAAIRHLKLSHHEVYQLVKKAKEKSVDESQLPAAIEIRVIVNINEIENAVVDLVTKHAIPLACVEYPAFRKLIEPYRIALNHKGIELNITRTSIRTLITKRAEHLKNTIRNELKKKMVCLMVDIASRYNRSIFGVNIAFMKEDSLAIRTIGMHSLHIAHTGKNILQKLSLYSK